MRRRISIRGYVRRSVGPSVRRSVCPVLFSKEKRTPTRRILCRVSGLVKTFFSTRFFPNSPISEFLVKAIHLMAFPAMIFIMPNIRHVTPTISPSLRIPHNDIPSDGILSDGIYYAQRLSRDTYNLTFPAHSP